MAKLLQVSNTLMVNPDAVIAVRMTTRHELVIRLTNGGDFTIERYPTEQDVYVAFIALICKIRES